MVLAVVADDGDGVGVDLVVDGDDDVAAVASRMLLDIPRSVSSAPVGTYVKNRPAILLHFVVAERDAAAVVVDPVFDLHSYCRYYC